MKKSIKLDLEMQMSLDDKVENYECLSGRNFICIASLSKIYSILFGEDIPLHNFAILTVSDKEFDGSAKIENMCFDQRLCYINDQDKGIIMSEFVYPRFVEFFKSFWFFGFLGKMSKPKTFYVKWENECDIIWENNLTKGKTSV